MDALSLVLGFCIGYVLCMILAIANLISLERYEKRKRGGDRDG